ncbi:hypothetical protein NDU88_002559 [Pleurodeles waltl]|uniref:Uncharacterized protein n=1 Tax=Pleurodeles waltl TaxID=8319 RepID=A0AAV7UBV3_PLEWA|nr:hypothetical protein NDU88_002557 [Pleurodeles waltl]KAJ1185771.1 hypothetical protein NDU88_002558 [Pleurodeles waltl]KAJ1185772.1 hypothetical protein NDU88_002559 [Pleurodeles waltl]
MRAPYLLNGVSRRKQTGAAWCAREKPRTPGSAGVGGKWRMGVLKWGKSGYVEKIIVTRLAPFIFDAHPPST